MSNIVILINPTQMYNRYRRQDHTSNCGPMLTSSLDTPRTCSLSSERQHVSQLSSKPFISSMESHDHDGKHKHSVFRRTFDALHPIVFLFNKDIPYYIIFRYSTRPVSILFRKTNHFIPFGLIPSFIICTTHITFNLLCVHEFTQKGHLVIFS